MRSKQGPGHFLDVLKGGEGPQKWSISSECDLTMYSQKQKMDANFKVSSCLMISKVHMTDPAPFLTQFVRKLKIDQK